MQSDQCPADLSHWTIEPFKVLVVSPFECIRENISFALDFFTGATTVEAVDYAMARTRIAGIEPDLILAHADWPRTDALRLVSDVRRGATVLERATPIVMLMWRPSAERVRTVKYLGADDLIRIPFSASMLQVRVVRALERSGYRSVYGRNGRTAHACEWIQPIRPAAETPVLTHDEIALLLRSPLDTPKVVLPTD